MMNVQEQQLIDTIVAHPDQPDAYLVYADWLQARRDPLGNWIAINYALEHRRGDWVLARQVETLLKKHQQQWLGPLHIPKEQRALWQWRFGFVRQLRVFPYWREKLELSELVSQVLQLPLCRFLDEAVFFDTPSHGEQAALKKVCKTYRPQTLRQITFVQRYMEPKEAFKKPDQARYTLIEGLQPECLPYSEQETIEALPHKLPHLEWLKLQECEIKSLPASIGQLALRRLELDRCKQLSELPIELFASETLGQFTTNDCPKLRGKYHMKRINTLLSGLIQARAPKEQRELEVDLLFDRQDRVLEGKRVDLLLHALDSNVAQVREGALLCLEQLLPNALEQAPLGPTSQLALCGKLRTGKQRLQQDLSAIKVKLAGKIGPQTTHVLVGLQPKGKQHNLKLPLLLEAHLISALKGDQVSEPAVTTYRADLAPQLRSKDVAVTTKALEALDGGGVEPALFADLLVVNHDLDLPAPLRTKAKALLDLYAPQLSVPMKKLKASLLGPMAEGKRKDRVLALCKSTGLDPIHLGRLMHDRAGVGAKLLIEEGDQQVVRWVFEQRTKDHALDLARHDLQQLPEELYELTSLRRLDLSRNQLKKVPPQIGRLTALRELDLHHNKLKELPAELGQLVELTVLNLDDNLIKTLAVELAALKQLEHLEVENNSLRAFPELVLSLTKLRVLRLGSHVDKAPLVGLPEEIGKLQQLREFSYSHNQIDQFPDGFFELNRLERLDLSVGAKLPDQVPPQLKRFTALKELHCYAWGDKPKRYLPKGCEVI